MRVSPAALEFGRGTRSTLTLAKGSDDGDGERLLDMVGSWLTAFVLMLEEE